jgi:hypothetical protein
MVVVAMTGGGTVVMGAVVMGVMVMGVVMSQTAQPTLRSPEKARMRTR